ncbi:MAG: hypothetical protein ABFC84_00590 [Veillonellales bacterium]
MIKNNEKVKCIKCQYHYITWDRDFPHGCKVLGFKSRKIPSLVVRESSGQECLAFTNKQKDGH